MKFLLSLLLLLVTCNNGLAQEIKSPQSETYEALKNLNSLKDVELERYTKYFTFYSVPNETIPQYIDALRFWIHSMSSEGYVVQPKLVTSTLYSIDIRDYGWTEEAWEQVAKNDPYFRAPWIDYRAGNEHRIRAGNFIVNGPWFITHTSDNTKQLDAGQKEFYYYTLLYSGTKIPATIQEFRDAWGVEYLFGKQDQKIAGKPYRPGIIDLGFIIKSDAVARAGLRQVIRTNGITGPYWETYDSIHLDGDKNYIESLFSSNRDGGESIARNYVGMQVYIIFDAKGNRAEFGDPSLVRNATDPLSDVRVRVPFSCIDCHGPGINDFQNELLVRQGNFARLKAKKYAQQDINAFYLKNPNEVVADDQDSFARALKKINNLSPYENSVNFSRVIKNYNGEITLEQAAKECGVTVEDFKSRVGWSVSGDLVNILTNKGTIPRVVWENPKINAGTFGHAMLLLNPVDKLPLNVEVEKTEYEDVSVVKYKTAMYSESKIVGWIPADTEVKILDSSDIWRLVEYNGVKGWIKENTLTIVKEVK